MSTVVTVYLPTILTARDPSSIVRVKGPETVLTINEHDTIRVLRVEERTVTHVYALRDVLTVHQPSSHVRIGERGPEGPPGPGGGLDHEALDAFWRANHAPHKTLGWDGDALVAVVSRDAPAGAPTFTKALAYTNGRLETLTLTRHADDATFVRSLAYTDGRLATVVTA